MSLLIREAVVHAKQTALTRRSINAVWERSWIPTGPRLQLEAADFRSKTRPLFGSAINVLHAYIDTGSLYATDNGLGIVIDRYRSEEFGNRSVASKFEYSYRSGPDLAVTRTIRGGAGSLQAVEKIKLESALAKWLADAILAR